MSDMPERIHAWTWNGRRYAGQWEESFGGSRDVEYIRADKVAALVEALRECEAEIDGYIRQEYPGDHPVHERYRQRDFAANPARVALAALEAKP